MKDTLLVQVESKVIEPVDWEKRQIHIRIGFPTQVAQTETSIVDIGVERWNNNPAVFGIGGERELPIGGGFNTSYGDDGLDVEIRLRPDNNDDIVNAIEQLRLGKWSLVAMVLIEDVKETEWKGELVSINAMQSEDRLPVFVGERVAMENMNIHVGGLEPNNIWLLLRQNQSAENGVYIVDKDGFLKRPDHGLTRRAFPLSESRMPWW